MEEGTNGQTHNKSYLAHLRPILLFSYNGLIYLISRMDCYNLNLKVRASNTRGFEYNLDYVLHYTEEKIIEKIVLGF